jgi:hypothetical protein
MSYNEPSPPIDIRNVNQPFRTKNLIATGQLNSIGSASGLNYFGLTAEQNLIGRDANLNSIGDSANYNVIGQNSEFTLIGASSTQNEFGTLADINYLGAGAINNQFGIIANSNYFGEQAQVGNDFGPNTFINRFGLNAINYFGQQSANLFGTINSYNYFGGAGSVNEYGSGYCFGPFLFDTRPQVNNTGILLSGESTSFQLPRFSGLSSQSGQQGELRASGSFLYICTGTSSGWIRFSGSTF